MTTLVKRNQNWIPSIFNDLFDNEWIDATPRMNGGVAPAINVKETKNGYEVEVAAPGMTREDFNVNINEDNDLVISMEKKNEMKDENKETHYLRREFSYTKFQQAMLLPDDVDRSKISATVDKGILCINLPKVPERVERKATRQIDIK
ncbi:MAG: Hsp20/alpha crystallin family protein [Tidjanibacter sp.]|nr:Hsp20/alpha crystallin family protein [Tidjanibacter sp.]